MPDNGRATACGVRCGSGGDDKATGTTAGAVIGVGGGAGFLAAASPRPTVEIARAITIPATAVRARIDAPITVRAARPIRARAVAQRVTSRPRRLVAALSVDSTSAGRMVPAPGGRSRA